jgi:glycosyltransferase involved in cell wall biosynthesis
MKVRFVLVGRPDPGNPTSISESTLHSWEQEGVIEWWGWRQDMQKVYRSSHIITLPSYREGAPTVLLEAAASARPIVATDVPGCRDVVKDGVNGLLVPVNNPEALAEAIEKLVVSASLRQNMGQAGRKMVLERYTQSLVNEAYERIYQSLL